jgi:hypothetical protein
MKLTIKNFAATIGIALLGINTLPNTASAEEKISVHGYGDTGFARAVENNYTQKPSGNNWDLNYLSVNFTALIDEKTKIVAQIRQGSEIVGDMGAYVNYNVTDNLTGRAGQMKVPAGIFNEIRDIKFLQLSELTPLMYQDAAGTLPDSFKGAEAIYHIDMGAHRLTLDVYGGEPKGANTYIGQSATYFVMVQNIYGGRLTYKTPIGLKFSLSTFQNDLLSTPGTGGVRNTTATPVEGVRKLSSASIDYRNYNFDIKMEYAIASQFPGTPAEVNGKAYYGQFGYTFAEKFTPYARYDYLLYNNDFADNPMYYQQAKVLGFTYSLNSSVSLRMENHWNHGYAIPANIQGGNFNSSTAKLDWNLFAMGVNFIF